MWFKKKNKVVEIIVGVLKYFKQFRPKLVSYERYIKDDAIYIQLRFLYFFGITKSGQEYFQYGVREPYMRYTTSPKENYIELTVPLGGDSFTEETLKEISNKLGWKIA